MAKASPLPEGKKHGADDYQIVLRFNHKAELTKVDYPTNLSVEMVNNHVAVAGLYLAQLLVEAKNRESV